ncbi:hypothetical protein NMG60_11009774 [Bertholletia excelsa]
MCETKSFTLWALQVVLLLGLLVLVLWLSLRPRPPSFLVVNFSIPTSNNTTRENANLNSSAQFVLEIDNPNKDSGIYYDDASLTFYYGPDAMGQKTLPGFYQKKSTTSQVTDRVSLDGKVWKRLVNALSNVTQEVKVAVATRVRYRVWGHKSKHQGIRLHGKLPIGSDGKISGKKKKIKLRRNTRKWKV